MSEKREISMRVNGEKVTVQADIRDTLQDILREKLEKRGVKHGCEAEGCGACTVLVNSENVYSCMFPAMNADGKDVTTIDGLGSEQELDRIQYEFMNEWAFQCGYCTPGFIMAVKAMESEVRKDPRVVESIHGGDLDEYIKDGLTGHICRCTGYIPIHQAARKRLDEIMNAGRS
ncbi:hypothetical protein IX51_02935 [uncultured archaeon]|nr:hypothetical protein IX51_02935 [uncultured archaeon]